VLEIHKDLWENVLETDDVKELVTAPKQSSVLAHASYHQFIAEITIKVNETTNLTV
jgi:hypothetical protein